MGNSRVAVIHATFIIAVYFTTIVKSENGTAYLGDYMTAAAALLVAILQPLGYKLCLTILHKLYLLLSQIIIVLILLK